MNKPQFLWVERYRPKTVDECILPDNLKKIFKGMVASGSIPDMTLVGGPGTGKTTVARAMLDELDCDYVLIPATMKGNIDTLRNEMMGYASSVSFKGKRKYIILDEADYLTHVTQPALRNFMDQFSRNCGFILTANYGNRIIEAVQSRCPPIEFVIDKADAPALALQFYKRVQEILVTEGVEYDKSTVANIIHKYYPDWRRVLGVLQHNAIGGKIDAVVNVTANITELTKFMKDKDFTNVRKWVAENLNNDQDVVFREFYDQASNLFEKVFIPELVLILAKYLYQASFGQDPEINFTAAMVEIMMTAQWR